MNLILWAVFQIALCNKKLWPVMPSINHGNFVAQKWKIENLIVCWPTTRERIEQTYLCTRFWWSWFLIWIFRKYVEEGFALIKFAWLQTIRPTDWPHRSQCFFSIFSLDQNIYKMCPPFCLQSAHLTRDPASWPSQADPSALSSDQLSVNLRPAPIRVRDEINIFLKFKKKL